MSKILKLMILAQMLVEMILIYNSLNPEMKNTSRDDKFDLLVITCQNKLR